MNNSDTQTIFDTNAAAEYLGMSVANWKRWVWTHPDEARRCPPDGHVGRSPYWKRETLDQWRETKYRTVGRPPTRDDTPTEEN